MVPDRKSRAMNFADWLSSYRCLPETMGEGLRGCADIHTTVDPRRRCETVFDMLTISIFC
jgi:hypothetical protein